VESLSPESLIARLNRDAERIAARFGLRYAAIEAERPRVKRRYGVCYADGTIRIRLRHAATGRPLKYSSLVNTLCHELAHLRHFNHGLRFQRFYQQILEYARGERIYAPGRAPALPAAASAPPRRTAQQVTRPLAGARAAPLQLALFGPE
jgi:predicted metal-dependent hydrolase